MTKKELLLYLKSISNGLHLVAELVERNMPTESERIKIQKKRIKLEREKEINAKKNQFLPTGMYLKDEDYEYYTEDGGILALSPLYKFIENFDDDINNS